MSEPSREIEWNGISNRYQISPPNATLFQRREARVESSRSRWTRSSRRSSSPQRCALSLQRLGESEEASHPASRIRLTIHNKVGSNPKLSTVKDTQRWRWVPGTPGPKWLIVGKMNEAPEGPKERFRTFRWRDRNIASLATSAHQRQNRWYPRFKIFSHQG